MSKGNKIIGAGLLTAIASSLCCIAPILALISGTTGMASSFSWMEPFRPYLIVFTVLVLAFAWYQKLKPKKEIDCNCETEEKLSFFQSKLFLGIVTVFAVVMTLFPYYSSVFYGNNKKEIIVVDKLNIKKVKVAIKGMTCESCEEHVNHTVNQLNGVLNTNTSYENGATEVKFDNTKTSEKEIKNAINSTGYKVINQKEN